MSVFVMSPETEESISIIHKNDVTGDIQSNQFFSRKAMVVGATAVEVREEDGSLGVIYAKGYVNDPYFCPAPMTQEQTEAIAKKLGFSQFAHVDDEGIVYVTQRLDKVLNPNFKQSL